MTSLTSLWTKIEMQIIVYQLFWHRVMQLFETQTCCSNSFAMWRVDIVNMTT